MPGKTTNRIAPAPSLTDRREPGARGCDAVPRGRIRRFIADASAATAIEYALIASLIALMTLGAITLSGERLRGLLDTVRAPIAGFSGSGWRDVVALDFAGGAGAWDCQGPNCPQDLRVEQFGDWGWMLGPHGRDMWPNNWLSFPVSLSEDATVALIEFDLFIIDSWDGVGTRFSRGGVTGTEGDAVRFRIDDTTFSTQQFIHAANPALLGGEPGNLFDPARVEHNQALLDPVRSESGTLGAGAFTMTMTLVESGHDPSRGHSQSGSNAWEDQRWRVQLEIENPQQEFNFQMMPTLSQTLDDEALGIANFSIRER